jgi:hypothetical protein
MRRESRTDSLGVGTSQRERPTIGGGYSMGHQSRDVRRSFEAEEVAPMVLLFEHDRLYLVPRSRLDVF